MTLIFDFDGTLHQTARIYIPAFRAARAALVAQGYPVRAFADAEITSFLGLNIHDMWRSFLPQAPAEVQAKGARIIGSALDAALARGNAALYPGIPEALYALKRAGHTLVLLSNCRHSYGEAARARFGLDRWFSGYYFCEDYQNVPKEEIFPAISQAFPGPYLMIGDRTTDRRVAQTHGFGFVGCAYGYGTPEELAGANALCATASQIPQAIERLSSH